MNKTLRTLLHILAIALVFAVAFGLRTQAAEKLSIDYDEDDYLRAAQEFAHLIRTSDWRGFLDTNYRPEHPPLAKIAYALSLLHLPERAFADDVAVTDPPASYLPPDQLHAARTEASIFGSVPWVFICPRL